MYVTDGFWRQVGLQGLKFLAEHNLCLKKTMAGGLFFLSYLPLLQLRTFLLNRSESQAPSPSFLCLSCLSSAEEERTVSLWEV